MPSVGAIAEIITPNQSVKPLNQLYFSESSNVALSSSELIDEIEAYYCPNCLENLPSREAANLLMRCKKCFDCPLCFGTLRSGSFTDFGKENLYEGVEDNFKEQSVF